MKRKAVIFDIDGTLALRGDRDPHDMSRVGEDLPNYPIMLIYKALRFSFLFEVAEPRPEVILTSGRDECARWQTELWIEHHTGARPYWLLMRADGDGRRDDVVKREMLDRIEEDHEIVMVFDDRDRVVKMWRDNNITCAQVNWGNF